MNYPQFIDLRVDGVLVCTQLVTLEFTPDGQVVNNNRVEFPIKHKVRGKPSVHVLGTKLDVDMDDVDLRRGDTITVGVHRVSINLEPKP